MCTKYLIYTLYMTSSNSVFDNHNIEIHHEDPKIFTIDDFFTQKECEHIISIGKPKLSKSVVTGENGSFVSKGRSSQTSWIDHNHDAITKQMTKKVERLVNKPLLHAEKIQLVYYGIGNEYRPHYDGWEHNGSQKTYNSLRKGGQRLTTIIVYLNMVEDGGSTRFTKLDIDVKPKVGKLLYFDNTYTGTNNKHILSEHAGTPVIKGEKYIFNLWFREQNTSKDYMITNPSYYAKHYPNKVNVTNNHPGRNIQTMVALDTRGSIYKGNNAITQSECLRIIHDLKFDTSNNGRPCTWLNNSHNALKSVLSTMTKSTIPAMENPNVVQYFPHERHNRFCDAIDISSQKGKSLILKRGQRVRTIVLCMSEHMEYHFPNMKIKVSLTYGDILFYTNVMKDSNQRDLNMTHDVVNKSEKNGYLLNIYIREKDTEGKTIQNLNLISNTTDQLTDNQHQNNNNRESPKDLVELESKRTTPYTKKSIDYMQTFKCIKDMVSKHQLTKNFKELNGFSYTLKSDYDYFIDTVQKFVKYSKEDKCIAPILESYNFNVDTPLVVKSILQKPCLELFQSYYRQTINSGDYKLGDKQSNRYKMYNEPLSRFLQYELLSLIEKITEKKLRPTYTYLSSYVNQSVLPPHTDRDECQYTVSLLVNKDDIKWPLYVAKTKSVKKSINPNLSKENYHEIHTDINDFAIFCGRTRVHYREPYEGTFYDAILLHYNEI